MKRAAQGMPPGTKAVLIIGSAILHLAVFGLIWMLLPEGEKTVGHTPERTAIPEELIESVRRDVEQRQLEELKIKLSELENLQSAISEIRESRLKRWDRMSTALETFAPEAAAVIAVSAREAVTSLRGLLKREAWEVYRQAAASPEGGLTAREGVRPAASLGSTYEATRIALAALREQQRLLREKLALGGAGKEALVLSQTELEKRVSAAVASIDTVQQARAAHERAYNQHREALGRIGGIQRHRDSALEGLQKAQVSLEGTQTALAEALEGEKTADKTLQEADANDRRAVQNATNAVKKAKDLVSRRQRELKQREEGFKKAETQMATREQALEEARNALRDAENALPEALRDLENKRGTFTKELAALLDEQEKLNQGAGAES